MHQQKSVLIITSFMIQSKWLCSFYHVIFLLGIYLFFIIFFWARNKDCVVV